MIKILFVCLGNICRSPLAEGIFKKIIVENKLENKFSVDSAGTSDYHIGEDPDPRTFETARKYDISLESKGRQFNTEDFDKFDYIIVMDESNYEDVIALSRDDEDRNKVRFMRDFDPEMKEINVPDPYFGEKDGFREVYEILERSCKKFLKSLKNEYNL